jgi:hypothetical protein
MATVLRSLIRRVAIRTLAGGRAPSYLRPHLRVLGRAIGRNRPKPGPGGR